MHLLIFDTESVWIEAVVTFWRDRLRLHPSARFCLPSGHTPEKIFAAMVRAVSARQVSFRDAEIFALDEYGGLPPEEPGLCVNCLRRQLVQHVDLPAGRFHYLDAQAANLDQVCREYDAAIGAGFDITLLGLGLNGHLGLNEPGSLPDSPTRRVDMHPQTTQGAAKYLSQATLPTWGLTTGLKPLLASQEIWLIANGRSKAEAVRRLVTGPVGPEFPAACLQRHRNCYCFLDAEAAALI